MLGSESEVAVGNFVFPGRFARGPGLSARHLPWPGVRSNPFAPTGCVVVRDVREHEPPEGGRHPSYPWCGEPLRVRPRQRRMSTARVGSLPAEVPPAIMPKRPSGEIAPFIVIPKPETVRSSVPSAATVYSAFHIVEARSAP